jgi:hypothetical protein
MFVDVDDTPAVSIGRMVMRLSRHPAKQGAQGAVSPPAMTT